MSYFGSSYFDGFPWFGSGLGQEIPRPAPVFASLRAADAILPKGKPSYVYPRRDIDRPQTLLAELGGFWASVYDDELPARWAYQRAQLEAQSVQNLIEARDSLSRFDVPLFHTDQWHQLVLQESQLI